MVEADKLRRNSSSDRISGRRVRARASLRLDGSERAVAVLQSGAHVPHVAETHTDTEEVVEGRNRLSGAQWMDDKDRALAAFVAGTSSPPPSGSGGQARGSGSGSSGSAPRRAIAVLEVVPASLPEPTAEPVAAAASPGTNRDSPAAVAQVVTPATAPAPATNTPGSTPEARIAKLHDLCDDLSNQILSELEQWS